ncbi:MAG: M48 family metallopeptidase [Myxococcota bacterium]
MQAPWSFWFFRLLTGVILLRLLVEAGLELINMRHLRRGAGNVPQPLRQHLSPRTHRKTAAYGIAAGRWHLCVLPAQLAIAAAFIFTGIFDNIDQWLTHLAPKQPLTRSAFYPFIIVGLNSMLLQPLELYRLFVVEQRFGFNRTSLRTYVIDRLKSALLLLLLGWPVAILLLWLIEHAPTTWWLAGWGVVTSLQIALITALPTLMRVFYQLTPLREGPLKQRLLQLARTHKIPVCDIVVMNGSSRSNHSNAFFTGLGRTRRIVLFDTLLARMDHDEIVAVVAHEMGHDAARDVTAGLRLWALLYLIAFGALAFCLNQPSFFHALGCRGTGAHIGLVLFGWFAPMFLFPLKPLHNFLSRRQEYAADRFSVRITKDPDSLIRALFQLAKDNLSNPQPHPLYLAYHHSHPTALQRVHAIAGICP